MAIVDNPLEGTELDENNQDQNANQNQGLGSQEVQKTSTGGTLGSGGTPSAQGAAAPTQGAMSTRKPTSSGSFTNIQKYMQANKPAQFGKQVAGKVSGEAQQAAQQLGQAKSSFQEEVGKQRSGFVGADQMQSSVQALRDLTGQGDIRTGYDDQKRIAETGVSQRYTGPDQFVNLKDLSKKGKDLSTLAKQAATGEGQRSLLQRYYGSPKYSGGQQKLDSLLLSGEQTGALAKARQQAAIFDPRLRKSSEAAMAQAQDARQVADANRQQALQMAQAAREGETTELDELVKQRSEQYAKDVDAYRRNNEYNKALAGYDFSTLNEIMGTDVGASDTFRDRYTTASDLADITRSNADPAQAALANYFNRLVGEQDLVTNIADATPTAEEATYGLDQSVSKMQEDAQRMNQRYLRELTNQQAAHDAYYGAGGGEGGGRDWQIQDRLNEAARRLGEAENPLRALRERLTGTQGPVGGSQAAGIDVHRGQAALANRQAAKQAELSAWQNLDRDPDIETRRDPKTGHAYKYNKRTGTTHTHPGLR